jgi:two-component system, sensor histidine kinase YesM
MSILPFLRKIFRNTKVKKQLNFIFFVCLFIPILFIGIILIFNTKKLLLDHYHNLVEADNARVKSIMFDVTTTTYNISDEISTDKNLQTLFETQYSREEDAYNSCRVYYGKINKYITKNTFISSIDIYTTNPTIKDYSSIKTVSNDIFKEEWYNRASNHADIIWRSLATLDNWKHTSQELCLLRRIPIISTGEYVVLVIRVSNIYLKNRIQFSTPWNIVTVNQDPIFFSTDRNLSGKNITLPIDYSKQQDVYSGQFTYDNKESIVHISTLLPYTSKDKIYITTLDTDALKESNKIITTFIAIIALTSILPLILITLFTNRFSARIITLRGEMHKASKGDFDIINNLKGDDELSEVFCDLKVMIQSIKQMDSQMYEAKLQEHVLKNQQQKMEFKMLASQINPHFLYNTLEIIRMMALTEGNKGVSNAIKLLGKSMHYVLENNGSSSTSLKKELDYIATYLAIQKLRFGDRVNYTLNIPNNMDLEEYQILPLLLQPMVENAILHGLENIQYNGQIIIDVQTKEDEFLIIQVSDNGHGMTEDELNELKSNIQISKRKSNLSIGLYNINQRIKLFYGENYGMEIQSHPNDGTHVTLTIPLHNTMEE